jgi:hypothetical protein
VHPVLRHAADRSLGVFTARDARRAGYGHDEIRRLRSSGRWVRLRRGVYITAEDLAVLDARGHRHRADCLAVLLSLGDTRAVLSHTTAARLLGFPVRRGAETELRLTDPAHWRRGAGYRVVRAPTTPHEVFSSGPFRLTTAPRTLVDCAREWDLEDAVVAMDAALLAGRTTVPELRNAVTGAAHWPGAARADRAVGLTDGRAESALESRGRLRIVGAGFPRPELQVEIRTEGRVVGVVDAWYEEAAVAVEFDGRVKYTDPWRGRRPERVLWDEKRREDDLRALDIRVLRIADADLDGRWPRVEARLRELLALPGPAHRRFTAAPRARGLRRAG